MKAALTIIATVLLLAGMAPAASAQVGWQDYASEQKHWAGRALHDPGYEPYRYRNTYVVEHRRRWRRYRHHHRPQVRAYVHRERGYASREPGVRCLPPVRAIGPEKNTQKGAQKTARRAWEGAVRFDYGDKYMDIRNAQDVRYQCGRSSNNTTIIGKLGESLPGGAKELAILDRCVLIARPCTGGVILGDDAQLEADE